MTTFCKKIALLLILFFSNSLTNLNGENDLPLGEEPPNLAEPTDSRVTRICTASSKRWTNIPKELKNTTLRLHGIALFSGSSVLSRIIEDTTISKWSHTGIILCNQKNRGQNAWHCLEACHFPSKPFYEISSYNVHVLPWADSSFSKNVDVAVRTFEYDTEAGPSSNIVKDVISRYLGIPCEKHSSELFKAAFEANRTEDMSSVFCSELNALVLQNLRILSPKLLASN